MHNNTWEYTIKTTTYKLFGCAKRGCDKVNPDYLAFESKGKTYCLDHKPLLASLKLWWREDVKRDR